MQMADHNANIPNEYEKLHVLPYNFKVDDQEFIEDPLGMNGARLEVQVHIITAQKSSLSNLRKAVKSAGVEIDNIVLGCLCLCDCCFKSRRERTRRCGD